MVILRTLKAKAKRRCSSVSCGVTWAGGLFTSRAKRKRRVGWACGRCTCRWGAFPSGYPKSLAFMAVWKAPKIHGDLTSAVEDNVTLSRFSYAPLSCFGCFKSPIANFVLPCQVFSLILIGTFLFCSFNFYKNFFNETHPTSYTVKDYYHISVQKSGPIVL